MKRLDDKVKLAGYFINFTGAWMHVYNDYTGVKGDFRPACVDEKRKLVSIYDKSNLLPIAGKDIPLDELIDALDGTDVYCVVEDENAAERLFGDELEQVAMVAAKHLGRNDEAVTYLDWAADNNYKVLFASDKICI